jgi:hypothetical protein
LRQVQDAGGVALMSYVPRPYNGKIAFLKAETTAVTFPARPANIWAGLAKSFELHAVPGDHASMIHVHSDCVADCISACLAPSRHPGENRCRIKNSNKINSCRRPYRSAISFPIGRQERPIASC